MTEPDQRCTHDEVRCLNEFEFVRKYCCSACARVMMCSCDEDVARDVLAHQLKETKEYGTHKRFPVDLGFQPRICRECRGLPAEAHPVAEIRGRTSKIKRYYWREIWFLEQRLFRQWAVDHGLSPKKAGGPEANAARADAAARALAEIKRLHNEKPKYIYADESQDEVLRRHAVEVVDLHVTYSRTRGEDGHARVVDGDDRVSVEEYVIHHYAREGWSALTLESSPFHVLFGVYMWLVIQDPTDERGRVVMVGDRRDFDARKETRQVWFQHPEDFGSPEYAERRADAIKAHLSPEMFDRDNLLWFFDYWLEPSFSLRNYLWAHKDEDVGVARKLVEILPPATVVEILKFLVESYWARYLGWPDLLLWKAGEFFLAEVKSSGDKLSEDQKGWIRDNAERLRLPFKLVKLHRAATGD